MNGINIYKKSVLAGICILLLCGFFQKGKLPNGAYLATNVAGQKRVVGLSNKQANELLNKPLIIIKEDSLIYLEDTLIIKDVEYKRVNKDYILNAFNFSKIPLFLKNSHIAYYYELLFSEKSSLARLEIFCYYSKFFFEHEGYYYELRKSK